jgi:hypothetical protein
MRGASFQACLALALAAACAAGACSTKEPQASTFFDRSIAPVLQTSCVRTNTGAGCHVADSRGNAFGNLDLTSYDGVQLRRDLLLDYGPYLQPSLLVKNVAPFQVGLQLWDGSPEILVTTDIKHTGGPILNSAQSAYQTLRRWIENGATQNDTGVPPLTLSRTACSDTIPSAAGFDPTTDPTTADFAVFQQVANPVLQVSCAAGNCHGTTVNALYLTCGTTPTEVRWNYFAAVDYLAATPATSEIVRRPLATSEGGSYHEGGPLFASISDPGYVALAQWAGKHGPPQPGPLPSEFMFFAQKVQPVLVKKGCMMVQCHSAGMFHDFRLRGGSAGSFSLSATRRNYTFSLAQLSLESDDVRGSRLVRKNLYRPELCPSGSDGITHRGGPLFEDFGTPGADGGTAACGADYGAICDQAAYDYDTAPIDTLPAFCVIREWHRRERAARALPALSGIAYVSRPVPAGPDRPQDFDVFAGGASLHLLSATVTAGNVVPGTDASVDLTSCGLGAAPDVRRPAVSWDGATIAFAARSSATDPLAIYTMHADGTACAKQPDIANHAATANGLLEHDFDPAYSPPGPDGASRIVFASTRGNLNPAAFSYSGPQRTPADLSKPNANLYVLEPDPSTAGANRVRQLTWQLNMERMPSFMHDGRLIFTAEKREPGFYELALRRLNLDGGDYHPLYAQRSSIGYTQAAGVVELSHKDFATIFSNANAVHGAGVLAIFNRSIGLDFTSSNPKDYLIDPTVVPPSGPLYPEQDFFLHSLQVLPADGSYTSPSPLPDGQLLVSYGAGAPESFGGDYDIYVVDAASGTKTKLAGTAGTAETDAVAIYPRAPEGIFVSTPDEPNGHTYIGAPTETAADVTVLDMRVLASLLFQNTPTGRVIEDDLKSFDIYEELPPDVTSPTCPTAFSAMDAYGQVCVHRRILGTVPVLADGSAHFKIPGGVPILLHLGSDSESAPPMSLPRWQREAMSFSPGEHAHQAFPESFFNGLCSGCHGSISGHPVDSALRPDFLTQASSVQAVGEGASDYSGPPSGRSTTIQGPPSSP